MASQAFCDPCSEEDKSSFATRYCADCEEQLCKDCAESHLRFKAFKSHHVINLSAIGSTIHVPESAKKNCNIHVDILLDYYCTDHESVCCRACIPDCHRTCEKVLPLDQAAKDVKNSSLFVDIFKDITHIVETLDHLLANREQNIQLLEQNKITITEQIRMLKIRLIKHIDDLECDLVAKFVTMQEKNEAEIQKQKNDISKLSTTLCDSKNELEFLKNHGSNNQLFLALRENVSEIQKAESKLDYIISSTKQVEIKFYERKNLNMGSIGSVLDRSRSCSVQYRPLRNKNAQAQPYAAKPLIEFKSGVKLNLKSGENYYLTDLVVTRDNKLLLCNYNPSYPKVYVYSECKYFEKEITFPSDPFGIALIPHSSKAVVTMPLSKSIQFVDTASMTIAGNQVHVWFAFNGVAATEDKIFCGDEQGSIHVLDTNGLYQSKIPCCRSPIYFIVYNTLNNQLLVRSRGDLRCVKLDGTPVYRYNKISGVAGITMDKHENVYLAGYNTHSILRLSPDGKFHDTVLRKDDGVSYPYGVTFSRDFCKLVVLNNSHKSVVFYRFK
ncbi:unnamed protein product [Mytilus edulis]|uniref:B box-type domain-containing protein n=1 Tax=Mytilus edulis TaxID=6550 RepID=A0A8S3V2H3_MYTED|nr:unnamed protein product [Mytilus edulis]